MIKHLWTQFKNDTKGLAFIESALILPILLILLFGLFDMGQAVIINQKLTAATYTAADLVTRKSLVDDTDLDNAVGGAQLVIDPYSRDPFGIDIIGIEFDDDEEPVELWRHTDGMSPNPSLLDAAEGLGKEGEGVVAVMGIYTYTPLFSYLFTGDIDMTETTYMRGRRTSVVKHVDDVEE
jgi:hypothetical protein